MVPFIFHMIQQIDGQLNEEERKLLVESLGSGVNSAKVVIEVGTWLGGGSTLHFLKALQKNNQGHLWGIEASSEVYERMLANIRMAAPEAVHRFTPLFGFSEDVIPRWLSEQPEGFKIDVAFLDGGDNPLEQIKEFEFLDPFMPVGARLMAHDAQMRKGKWFVPFISSLDNWQCLVHDISPVGFLTAIKIHPMPSPQSLNSAKSLLRRLRIDPIEIIGRFIPRKLVPLIARTLPSSIIRSITAGRRE